MKLQYVDGFGHPARVVARSRKFESKVWDLSTKTDDGKLEELFVVVSGKYPSFSVSDLKNHKN